MMPNALLAGDDLCTLLTLATILGPENYAPILLESKHPMESLLRSPMPATDAAIVELHGDESVEDVERLFSLHPHTWFVFTGRECLTDAAVVAVVEHGGVIARRDQSALVTAASLVALMSGVGSWGRAGGR